MACVPAEQLTGIEMGLETASRKDYAGAGDGGLEHSTYWAIKKGTPEFDALPVEEQAKLTKMQASLLHALELVPTGETAGTEITGTLVVGSGVDERRQEIVFKVPANWNGQLVVVGTPGTRNEFASEGTIAPWVLKRGYAYISGNKGMTNGGVDGNATLLNKTHPTRHWGEMMLDMATWASERLAEVTCKAPEHVYAVGLSNGGYQVRRALEIDHAKTQGGAARIFSGGLDWSGAYWPDARMLDADQSGTVTPAEYAAANHLVGTNEKAALAMKWAYDPATSSTPAAYQEMPKFSAAQAAMAAAGFAPESATIWSAYNTAFDSFKAQLPQFKGIGYYNFTAYYFRAELLGHDLPESAAYSCFPPNGTDPPPFYAWLAQAQDGGWTAESVMHALANANTGEFSTPLISVHGDADGLLGLGANATAYEDAVKKYGNADQYRLFVIANGGHVDLHSDGLLDFDFDGTPANEGAAAAFTFVQPYAERGFDYLVDWAEKQVAPPASKTVATDPTKDVLDAASITF
jgi:hypothetical protein